MVAQLICQENYAAASPVFHRCPLLLRVHNDNQSIFCFFLWLISIAAFIEEDFATLLLSDSSLSESALCMSPGVAKVTFGELENLRLRGLAGSLPAAAEDALGLLTS